MTTSKLTSAILLLSMTAGWVRAGEFYDRARVIRYERVAGTITERRPDCAVKPAGDDLFRLLQWDLGATECEMTSPYSDPGTRGEGYRVFFEWDGQAFSQIMDEPPGPWIPVQVMVE